MDNSPESQHTPSQGEEPELLRLISRGLGNKEIAARFGVSETAIKKRISLLMKRHRVSNRAALVRAAFEAGLLDDSTGGKKPQG